MLCEGILSLKSATFSYIQLEWKVIVVQKFIQWEIVFASHFPMFFRYFHVILQKPDKTEGDFPMPITYSFSYLRVSFNVANIFFWKWKGQGSGIRICIHL